MLVETIPSGSFVALYTGDRKWTALEPVVKSLQILPSNAIVVHGWADGLDTVVDVAATEMGFRVIRCPAHWRHNVKKCVQVWGSCDVDCKEIVGRAAGPIRNHSMYDNYHPHIVNAFHDDIKNSKGTLEMATYALKRGTPVQLHTTYNNPEGIPFQLLTGSGKSAKLQPNKTVQDVLTFFDLNES
jgi:hypothetical protein